MTASERRVISAAMQGKPHKARATTKGAEAWWYENPEAIEIYVYQNGVTLACRIGHTAIQGWLKHRSAGYATLHSRSRRKRK